MWGGRLFLLLSQPLLSMAKISQPQVARVVLRPLRDGSGGRVGRQLELHIDV